VGEELDFIEVYLALLLQVRVEQVVAVLEVSLSRVLEMRVLPILVAVAGLLLLTTWQVEALLARAAQAVLAS
jgi:hypothetical protein